MRTVLHTEASPGLGGQEIRTLDEARWTAERGWRVLLACQPGGRLHARARELGLDPISMSMRGVWDLAAARRLVGVIRAEAVSLVHTHSSVDAWLAGMAGRIARVPVVRSRHVSIPIRARFNPVYTWLADRVVTSGEVIRGLVTAAGVPPHRVVAIPAGLDLDRFRPGLDREPVRRDLGLSPPVIGSVAMFRGSKGHEHLLDAFSLLRPRYPRATLLLVGDGARRAWVEEMAKAKGLGDAVRFTGFDPDVERLLAAMDCFVLASTRTEGVPQSLLQAFACEVPVVATAVGGIPEVVQDHVTGLLAKPADATDLAQAIGRVLAEPATAAARAGAARRLAQERFSHGASVARLLAVYEEVLAARPPTGQDR